MRTFALLLSLVLLAVPAWAEQPRSVRVEFSLSTAPDSATIGDTDRSLNEGRDAFRVFCDHAQRITSGPRNYGCSANILRNAGDFLLWDNREYRSTGETFDLFAGRTASLQEDGVAFSARLRIPVGKRWDAVVGFHQGRTLTLREEAFRDYARLDSQEPRYWFYDSQGTFGGGFHYLERLHLSRHYREESAVVTHRSRTLSIGADGLLFSRGRLSSSAAGGLDIRVDRSDGERTVREYDYRQFLPDDRFRSYFGLPPQRPEDSRRQIGPTVTEHRSATDVQLLPYLGARLDVRLVGRLSVTSGVRWYPTVQETLSSQESILGPFDVSSRPERFTATLGATWAF